MSQVIEQEIVGIDGYILGIRYIEQEIVGIDGYILDIRYIESHDYDFGESNSIPFNNIGTDTQ